MASTCGSSSATRGLEFEHPVRVRFLRRRRVPRRRASRLVRRHQPTTTASRRRPGVGRPARARSRHRARSIALAASERLRRVRHPRVVRRRAQADGRPRHRRRRHRGEAHDRARAHPRAPGPALRPRRTSYERAGTSGEDAALGALIEGDATLVEHAYLWSLPEHRARTRTGDAGRRRDRAAAVARRSGDVPARRGRSCTTCGRRSTTTWRRPRSTSRSPRTAASTSTSCSGRRRVRRRPSSTRSRWRHDDRADAGDAAAVRRRRGATR